MESVKLFYCVKSCDETNCFNNHIAKIYKIEDHIKSCFKTHLIRDKFLSYGFWQKATVSEASHIQYLDSDGFIHVVSLASKEPILGHKLIRAPATRGLRNWWLPSPLWHMGGKSPQKQRRPIIIEQN